MAAFTQTEFAIVNAAYQRATARIESLVKSNERRASEIRSVAIDTLTAHQQQIEDLGFFEKDDFSPEEIKSSLEAAAGISAAEDSLEDAHELTLMELESDLANVIQKLGLDEYIAILRLHWLSAKRYSAYLSKDIPEDVRDEFSILLLSKTQARLNQIAHGVRVVADQKSLNSDDYSSRDFFVAVLNAGKYGAKEATDNYISLQKMKAAERAAQQESEANEVSLGGQIWEVIGWDSPTDFLVDVAIIAASGGAGKVVKWAGRLNRARARADKAAKSLETALKIKDRVRRMEDRISDVRNAAERLKKAKNLAELPRKITAAFKELQKARGKMKLAEMVGSKVTLDYIRSVATSVAAKSTGLGGSTQIGEAATKEAAKTALMASLDGSALGAEIKRLRGKINYTLIIATGFNSKNQERLMAYFGLLLVREFVVRMAISFAHKRSLSAEYVTSEFVDSALSALEKITLDLPLLSKAQAQFMIKTIAELIRKTIAEIGKTIAGDLSSGAARSTP
ncbi:MAG: hypothetical protein LH610_08055 [Sphingomonas bacterium]|nr:hypothetical protein [Sphingomonas bacterium]